MEEYIKYQHVCKMGTRDTDGILSGTVYVFPKIDGTNAHAWKDEDGIHYGSRRRELELGKDNAGFMTEMVSSKAIDDLMNSLPDNTHVFGEWLVPHTLKTYNKNAWRKFYIFDIVSSDGVHVHYNVMKEILDNIGWVDYIAPLRVLENPSKDDIMRVLEENDFLIKDGEGIGEGVVIKNYDYRNEFGRQVWAKVVTSDFRNKHRRSETPEAIKCADQVEPQIIEAFLTRDIIDKVVAHIQMDMDPQCSFEEMDRSERGRAIPRLINTVWHDFITECMFDALKKFNNPTVDYKYLQRLATSQIKEIREDIF